MPQFVILNTAADQPEARQLCHLLGPPGGVSVNVEAFDLDTLSFGAHLPLIIFWTGDDPEKAHANAGLLRVLQQNPNRVVFAIKQGAAPPENVAPGQVNLLRLSGNADQDGPALAAALKLAVPGQSASARATNSASRPAGNRGRLAVLLIGGVIAGGIAFAAWAAMAVMQSAENAPKPPVSAPAIVPEPVPAPAPPPIETNTPPPPGSVPELKGSLSVSEEAPPAQQPEAPPPAPPN